MLMSSPSIADVLSSQVAPEEGRMGPQEANHGNC